MKGVLPVGTKLPSSRMLSELLSVHRKTIIATYEELILQGWIVSISKKGTFVQEKLPVSDYQKLEHESKKDLTNQGFSFYKSNSPQHNHQISNIDWSIVNDGVSDQRLVPIEEISKIYKYVATKKSSISQLTYGDRKGNSTLRNTLVNYLNKTRGLNIGIENILITRGSQMGIYLSTELLLQQNDIIVVGNTNYISADYTFLDKKAQLKRVTVDHEGIKTAEVEQLCKNHQIRAVYVTPHHHHPTTVTLSAQRRIHLLNLAQKYQFAIIEDDYDYDFHYNHAPILPLASLDHNNNVIYIGSICKTVAPVFRIGYLIASEQFIEECSKRRGFIDRQGDALLELTFAEFIQNGSLDRHIRKILKVFRKRRDYLCALFRSELSEYVNFEIPQGGMAVWVHLSTSLTWKQIAEEALHHQLEVGSYFRYDIIKSNHNCIRIGFAQQNEEELTQMVKRLKSTILAVVN